jgi:hypothetical protein
MPVKPRVLAATAATILAIGASASAVVASSTDAATDRALCGTERWTVKTLQDRPLLLPVQNTTVRYLVTRRPPPVLPLTRLPFERHVFTVVATVVLVRPELDGDLHVILKSGRDQMITEAPLAGCTARAFPLRRRQMASARAAVRVCTRARVTGVAFFDFMHGQTGAALNAIELHPILGFKCLSG